MTASAAHARDTAKAALQLASLLHSCSVIQWQAAPNPRPRDDTTERAKGLHSDPTPTIALDERRLALREHVVAAEEILRDGAKALAQHVRDLEAAIEAWQGR